MDSKKESNIKINKANFIAYKTGSITKDYNFGKNLGSGSFGTVRQAVHKQTGQTRAVKILKKNEQDEEKLFLEVDILAKLSHPNIMQIYEFYDDQTNFYIISEFCPGGELFDTISEKGVFSESEAAHLMKQMLSAVCYSHQNNVVHRDLKPENILLDDKTDDPVIKLIDWGGARYFSRNKKMTKISGTPYYIAPEVLNEVYDEKCDIWSCGVILYILLCGYPPFNGDTDTDIMKAVKKGKFDYPVEEWGSISKEAKDLVSNMLKYDPKNRFSALECLSHPWIKKHEQLVDAKISQNAIKNMKQFKVRNIYLIVLTSQASRKLEQATLSFIVNQLVSKEERNKLLKQFQEWDKNGDGVLSRDEIYQGYKELYGEVIANEEVDTIMQSVDLDGNGSIDYNEFLTATMNREKILSKQNLELAFKSFDRDGSGKISVDEIAQIFNQNQSAVDNSVFESIIKDADQNGDGEISFDEFKEIMAQMFN